MGAFLDDMRGVAITMESTYFINRYSTQQSIPLSTIIAL